MSEIAKLYEEIRLKLGPDLAQLAVGFFSDDDQDYVRNKLENVCEYAVRSNNEELLRSTHIKCPDTCCAVAAAVEANNLSMAKIAHELGEGDLWDLYGHAVRHNNPHMMEWLYQVGAPPHDLSEYHLPDFPMPLFRIGLRVWPKEYWLWLRVVRCERDCGLYRCGGCDHEYCVIAKLKHMRLVNYKWSGGCRERTEAPCVKDPHINAVRTHRISFLPGNSRPDKKKS